MDSKPPTEDAIYAKAKKSNSDAVASVESDLLKMAEERRPKSRAPSTAMDHSTRTAVSPLATFTPYASSRSRSAKSPNVKQEGISPMEKGGVYTQETRGRPTTPKTTTNSMKTGQSGISNTSMNSGYSPNEKSQGSLKNKSANSTRTAGSTSTRTAKLIKTPGRALTPGAPGTPGGHNTRTAKSIKAPGQPTTLSCKIVPANASSTKSAKTPGLTASKMGATGTPNPGRTLTPGGNSTRTAKSIKAPGQPTTPTVKTSHKSERQGTPHPKKKDGDLDTARSTKSHERKIGALRSGKFFGSTATAKDSFKKPATPQTSTKERTSRRVSAPVSVPNATALEKSVQSTLKNPAVSAGAFTAATQTAATGTSRRACIASTQNQSSVRSSRSSSRSSSFQSTQGSRTPLPRSTKKPVESVYIAPVLGGLRSAAAIQPVPDAPVDYFGAQAPIVKKPAVLKTCITYNIREAEIPKTPNVRAWTPEPKNQTPATTPSAPVNKAALPSKDKSPYQHAWTPVPKTPNQNGEASTKSQKSKKSNSKNLDRSISEKSLSGKKLKSAGKKSMPSPAVHTAKGIFQSPASTARSVTPNTGYPITPNAIRALASQNSNDGVVITSQLPDGSFKVELKVSIRCPSESGRITIGGHAPEGLKTAKVDVNGENVYSKKN